MASQENLKPLKTLVISMGVLLMAATVMMMTVVWNKASQEDVKQTCQGGILDLTGRGKITNKLINNDIVRITLQKQVGREEIVSADLCSGKILGRLSIEADKQ